MLIRREGALFALLLTAPVTSANVYTDSDVKAVAFTGKCGSTGAFPRVSYDGDPRTRRESVFLKRPAVPPAGQFRAVPGGLENLAANRKIRIL